jgi:regulator of sigma E protease
VLLTVASLIVVLGVLIFVHEAGHFVAAKAMGIQVLRFSLGFGRPIVRVRRGETEYRVSWLPIGGYVKMAGLEEEGIAGELEGGKPTEPIDPARAFDKKPVWRRLVVILAGVTMNMVFAYFAYVALGYAGVLSNQLATTQVDSVRVADLPGEVAGLAGLRRGDRVVTVNGDSVETFDDMIGRIVATSGRVRLGVAGRAAPIEIVLPPLPDTAVRASVSRALVPYIPPVVADVQPGGPGARAGLAPGDRVLRVDRDTVASWADFSRMIRARPGQQVTVTLARGDSVLHLDMVPERKVDTDPDTKQERVYGMVGVMVRLPSLPKPGFVGALRLGWRETAFRTGLVLQIVRRPRVQELGGILTIGQLSGQQARSGFGPFLAFMAFLSINLAVLNLLPIPILDGGQVVFLLAEAIRRRPLSLELRARLTQIGFVVLVAIMLIALRNDVLRVFPSVFSR